MHLLNLLLNLQPDSSAPLASGAALPFLPVQNAGSPLFVDILAGLVAAQPQQIAIATDQTQQPQLTSQEVDPSTSNTHWVPNVATLSPTGKPQLLGSTHFVTLPPPTVEPEWQTSSALELPGPPITLTAPIAAAAAISTTHLESAAASAIESVPAPTQPSDLTASIAAAHQTGLVTRDSNRPAFQLRQATTYSAPALSRTSQDLTSPTVIATPETKQAGANQRQIVDSSLNTPHQLATPDVVGESANPKTESAAEKPLQPFTASGHVKPDPRPQLSAAENTYAAFSIKERLPYDGKYLEKPAEGIKSVDAQRKNSPVDIASVRVAPSIHSPAIKVSTPIESNMAIFDQPLSKSSINVPFSPTIQQSNHSIITPRPAEPLARSTPAPHQLMASVDQPVTTLPDPTNIDLQLAKEVQFRSVVTPTPNQTPVEQSALPAIPVALQLIPRSAKSVGENSVSTTERAATVESTGGLFPIAQASQSSPFQQQVFSALQFTISRISRPQSELSERVAGAAPIHDIQNRPWQTMEWMEAGVRPAEMTNVSLNEVAAQTPSDTIRTPVTEWIQRLMEAVLQSADKPHQADDGGSRIRIELDPPELGSLTVVVDNNRSGTRISIQADSLESQQLLEQHARTLVQALEKAGVHLQDLEFSQRQPSFSQNTDRDQSQPEPAQNLPDQSQSQPTKTRPHESPQRIRIVA